MVALLSMQMKMTTNNRFKLFFADKAIVSLDNLEHDKSLLKRLKAVRKALAYLEIDLRHPSLNTHKYTCLHGPNGEEVFEAYTENKTPAAYRLFWYYGPTKKEITILAITPHP